MDDIIKQEEDLDEPVPARELQQLREETRILSSVYRHVEHQQAVEQVAEVAALHPKADSPGGARDDSGHSPTYPVPLVQRIPSLTHSTVGSEGSGSLALQLRFSRTGSTEDGDTAGRGDTTEELLALPESLDTALKLNMTLQKNFRDKIQNLEKVLQENVTKQVKLKDEIREAKYTSGHELKWDGTGKPPLRISYFCVPYFKNRSGMNAPKNEDAKWKVDNGYLDLYTTRSRPWMIGERETLVKVVLQEWKEYKIGAWNSKLRELQRKLKNLNQDDQNSARKKAVEVDIAECEKCINTCTMTPPENIRPKPGANMDWEKIAAQAFDGHRSSEECRLQWENLLHPSINRMAWTEEEDITIQEMVLTSRSRIPDWEAIAKHLKTNRTAFLVMQRWVSFIDPTLNPAKWTPEATQKLIDTVSMLRIGTHIPWAQVHQHMVGFSRPQVQSRWRQINPEQSKGPFTVEEDFILIKGLHMFGLNFANIAHFMPGRNIVQVRERYKRTILPGLTTRPWSRNEDEILISQCQVGPRNWRKMIMLLPRRDACQIRCRYHVIQVWQTLTDSNMVPPPLFPVSMTVDPHQIKEIRRHMILESSNIKEIVDTSRDGMDVKSAVKDLENRRLIIKARKASRSVERMKRVTERRGRRPGVPNPHHISLQDVLLVDFFIPWRDTHTDFSHFYDHIQPSLLCLSKIFQLRILKEVTPSEQEMMRALELNDFDLKIVNQLITRHNHSDEIDLINECEACMLAYPERIPLLSPCQTTLGALRSLLLHRPKLAEMASGDFLLYKASKNDLMRLGSHPKLSKLRQGRIPSMTLQLGRNGVMQASQGNLSTVSTSDQNVKEEDVCNTSRLQWTAQSDSVPGTSGWRPGEYSEVDSQEESDANWRSDAEASDTQLPDKTNDWSPIKIHVTTMASDGKTVQNRRGARKMKSSLHVEKLGQARITTYSRGKGRPEASAEAMSNNASVNPSKTKASAGDPSLVESMVTEREEREDKEAHERADNILFQRMLSIFYWPAMMTMLSPPQDRVRKITRIAASTENAKKLPQEDDIVKQEKPKRSMLTKDELDIKEQEEYIHQLSKKHFMYEAWMNYRRCMKASTTSTASLGEERHVANVKVEPMETDFQQAEFAEALRTQEDEETHNSEMEVDVTAKVNPSKGRGRIRGRPRGSCRTHGRGRPRGRSRGRGRGHRSLTSILQPLEVNPEDIISPSTGERTGVAIFRRRQNLTSLRRSLVMKKIWEGRRDGSLPPRTSERIKRHYQPRASRTRDRVRKELLKPPKTPNPWDLPLDGPMKVQPQVPLDHQALKASNPAQTMKKNE